GVVVAISGLRIVPNIPETLDGAITYIAFGSALVFVLTRKPWLRSVCFVGLIASAGLVVRSDFFQSVFSLLLPTILHVFLFTGLFILVGALKGRNLSGIASLVVFALCALSFFVFT